MKYFLLLITLSLLGCSPSWQESPYEVYYIDGSKALGYHLGEGTYIGRIDEPEQIASNESYLSVYARPDGICAFITLIKSKTTSLLIMMSLFLGLTPSKRLLMFSGHCHCLY